MKVTFKNWNGGILLSKLTIRDIARMAGVSATAVSFVLNGREGVSDETRQKVQEIIRQTGFIPNVHTRRLSLGKSFTIHVVLRQYQYHLFNQFAQETLIGIFQASKQLGYSILFTYVDDRMDCNQILESVRSKDCDGVILNQISDANLISQLKRENIPFICVDAHMKRDGSVPLVEVDYYDAAYRATEYLCNCGHRKIGFIGPENPSEYYVSTFAGYSAALKEHNLVCNPAWMPQIRNQENPALEEIAQILKQKELPTAFFCAGDAFAIDTLRCAKLCGLRVPEDISLMGLDDLLVSSYLDPALSTMTFEKETLGMQAVELLYRIMQGENPEAVNLIPTKLVVRDSVKML